MRKLLFLCQYITVRHFSATGPSLSSSSNIRNIGVIAHVDAGKTTTTERMLYLSGYTQSIGNVDDGNTVMDYMEQERARGITITSAAITFPWKQCQLNLIDTPGHVDFTMEVERALRVLDGAVAILDASVGVEAQTLTVWKQANKYRIPRVIYCNKMDKSTASLQLCLRSIEQKLNCLPLAVQMPIVDDDDRFVGVVDLISLIKLQWEFNGKTADIKKISRIKLDPTIPIHNEAMQWRARLLDRVAQCNEQFAEHLLDKYSLNYDQVPSDQPLIVQLESMIREATLNGRVVPVLCGSSAQNVGVQPLMDSVVKYLPSPGDLSRNTAYEKFYPESSVNAFCFKIWHDHSKARKRMDTTTETTSVAGTAGVSLSKMRQNEREENILTFVRIYHGELIQKSKLYNVNKKCIEHCDKLYIPLSNRIKQVDKIQSGNIALISGLTKTITGDILVTSKQANDHAVLLIKKEIEMKKKEEEENKMKKSVLSPSELTAEDLKLMHFGLDVPAPVLFCTVEPNSESDEKQLHYALECLQREDPSLRVITNDNNSGKSDDDSSSSSGLDNTFQNSDEYFGQTLILGMGELHLEIIKDRLLKEYNLNVFFGKLNIAYKEKITVDQLREQFKLEKQIAQKKFVVQIELVLKLKDETDKGLFRFRNVNVVNDHRTDFVNSLEQDQIKAIDHGIRSALNKGCLLNYPIINTDVFLTQFKMSGGVTLPYVSLAAYKCTMNALKKAQCVLIQPVMKLEISTIKEFSSKVYNDLLRRNATNVETHEVEQISRKTSVENNKLIHIEAFVPLAQLTTYSTQLRKLTSGNTSFTIQFDSYQTITQKEFNELVQKKSF